MSADSGSPPAGVSQGPGGVDKEALKAKYRQERDKRLRPDGNAQYLALDGKLEQALPAPLQAYASDPYLPVERREPKRDHVRVAFIGGGFAGLLTGARLKEAGIRDLRILEKGGDFGGTWYWNRYPGAQCDTASLVYMPLLEETGHMPSEKYAHGPEIFEHCQRIARKYGLYEDALFHTKVTRVSWQEAAGRWRIETDRGDDFTASYVATGTGILHIPKLPGIPGILDFQGHAFHTSRWDYTYTGGDPKGAPMDNLADKRVAVIGTGATAIQCVPHLARACKQLYVFQRTPSSVDTRRNAPLDPAWFSSIATPGWQQRWLENFTANQSGLVDVAEDLVQDGWTEVARRIRGKIFALPESERTPLNMLAAYEDADFEKMEEIRARVDELVADPETAQKLKAWYRQLCKRPCFHDAYLQAFNTPNTQLVDTDGKGVERITDNAVWANGKAYEVDCIIYASGFDTSVEQSHKLGYDLVGRDGVTLSDYWSGGMRTKHGMHVHGFPNLFVVQSIQAGNLLSNVPHNLFEAAQTIATVIKHAEDKGFSRIEVTKAAEDAWIELLKSGPGRFIGGPDCTPGYYNNEGQEPGPEGDVLVGYPAGALAFFKYLQAWRESGDFEGLTFT